jgi:NAD(P)-dependent dehydrogenase (short-subunit alcohol dehydrogenase family)
MDQHADRVDFAGQVAVVTGGGRGIGRSFAEHLAAAGARVALIARSADELAEAVAGIEQRDGRAAAFPADVTDAGAMARIIAEIERSVGPIDLMVNNAGVLGPIGPFAEAAPEEWWRAIEINLRGPAIGTQAALPAMIARRRGRIVSVASGGGLRPIAYFSSYVAAKTALIRWSECLAAELKPHGIAVFALGPGTVRTALAEHALTSPEGRKWLPWFRRIFDEGLALPPERVARLLLSLASGRADALSGRFLQPSDDLDALLANLDDIERRNLYALRLQAIDGTPADPRFAAIAAAAARALPLK